MTMNTQEAPSLIIAFAAHIVLIQAQKNHPGPNQTGWLFFAITFIKLGICCRTASMIPAGMTDAAQQRHNIYCFNNSIPLRIRARDSSFPSTSIISVAPAGVICLPETAVRIGHIT